MFFVPGTVHRNDISIYGHQKKKLEIPIQYLTLQNFAKNEKNIAK